MIFDGLLKNTHVQIVGMVIADGIPFSWAGVKKLKKYLQKMGAKFAVLLLWQQCVQIFLFSIFRFLGRKTRLRSLENAAKNAQIPVLRLSNINGPEAIQALRLLQPDIIVSAYFNQILKREALSIARIAHLNVHPGWIPAYRGAMAYFWVLKNGERNAGVTIHEMDEGIDTGRILIRQSFALEPQWTQEQVLYKTASIGRQLLARVLHSIADGSFSTLEVDTTGEPEGSFSIPAKKDVSLYSSHRRFFRIRDILMHIRSVSDSPENT